MSEYKHVLEEIQEIDALYAQSFKIKSIVENLDGAFVTFANAQNEERILHVKMADTRKYFSTKLFEQVNN